MSYTGPPPSNPPPPDWRPPVVRLPAPPRELPPQDLVALTAAERQARRVSWAVAGTAALLALIAICALLSRLTSP